MVGVLGKKRAVVLLCALAAATLVVLVAVAASKKPAAAATDRLPDLGMAQLQNLRIKNCTETNFKDCAYVGQKQLRFDTRIVNVGAGKFEARGSRSTTSAPMTVTQRIYNDAGGFRNLSTTAQMYFARAMGTITGTCATWRATSLSAWT